MAKIKPSMRETETYSAPNFVRVHTAANGETCLATIEHLSYSAEAGEGRSAWRCETIADGEAMSREDALFIARNYAQQNDVPVIYECHTERAA